MQLLKFQLAVFDVSVPIWCAPFLDLGYVVPDTLDFLVHDTGGVRTEARLSDSPATPIAFLAGLYDSVSDVGGVREFRATEVMRRRQERSSEDHKAFEDAVQSFMTLSADGNGAMP